MKNALDALRTQASQLREDGLKGLSEPYKESTEPDPVREDPGDMVERALLVKAFDRKPDRDTMPWAVGLEEIPLAKFFEYQFGEGPGDQVPAAPCRDILARRRASCLSNRRAFRTRPCGHCSW
jgi:hypothetical protein